jgi:hypothetical protein
VSLCIDAGSLARDMVRQNPRHLIDVGAEQGKQANGCASLHPIVVVLGLSGGALALQHG